jgi:aspartyl-tRNA synthetase
VIGMIDGLMQRMAKKFLNMELKLPLPRMTWDEAMERFGHDAPDLRYGCELIDCTDLAATVDFRVFRETADVGKKVRGIRAPGGAAIYSRKILDELTEFVRQFEAKGLAWFRVEPDGTLWAPTAKQFTPEQLAKFAIPALVIQARADQGVFLSDARKMFEAVGSKYKSIELIPGNHYLEDGPDYRHRAAAIIADWLKTRA